MTQQELEIIINRIVTKQDELLAEIKNCREAESSVLLPRLESTHSILEEFVAEARNKDADNRRRFGEKLKAQLENGSQVLQTMERNCQLLEEIKDMDFRPKDNYFHRLTDWLRRNIAWCAFFSLSITVCLSTVLMVGYKERDSYQNISDRQLRILDQYLFEHPHALDSLQLNKDE